MHWKENVKNVSKRKIKGVNNESKINEEQKALV